MASLSRFSQLLFFGVAFLFFTPKGSSFPTKQLDVVVDGGPLGRIRGSLATTLSTSSRTYAQYIGIPYALKPERFSHSTVHDGPLTSNGDIFNATTFGSPCPQQGSGSEDCLFLNIFTPPTTNASVRFPVMVYIHGAAFVAGNANIYTGSRLLNKDVVLVSFNYRLGVMGFFNLENEMAPGNAALSDALTVLQWVQKYIHHFNGDPSVVTLAGQSSGAATTAHLVLSPKSQGLFHRALIASGSALEVWATSADPVLGAMTVARNAGCYDESIPIHAVNRTEVGLCMKNKTVEEVVRAQSLFQFLDMLSGSIGFDAINPSLDGNIIPERPETVLRAGRQQNVPLIVGATRDDGGFALRLLREGYLLPHGQINNTEFMKDTLVPTIFGAISVPDAANALADTFSRIYINEEVRQRGNFTELVPSLIDMLSVLFFKSGTHKTAMLHSKINPDTYFYSFDYEGRYTRHPIESGFDGGVAHADDIQYLFEMSGEFNEEEQKLSDWMVEYWTNFIITGNPNGNGVPQWPRTDPSSAINSGYLLIEDVPRAESNYAEKWVIQNKIEQSCPQTTTDSIDEQSTSTPEQSTQPNSSINISANISTTLFSLLLWVSTYRFM